jgi:hypothetical protein
MASFLNDERTYLTTALPTALALERRARDGWQHAAATSSGSVNENFIFNR